MSPASVRTLLLIVSGFLLASTEPVLSRLRNDLLKNYDKTLRPVRKGNDTTVVKMAFYISHLLELDEKTETLSAEGTIKMEWKDEHLTWNPSDYENVTSMHLGDHEIWQPDVYLFHSSGENSVDGDKSTYAQITSEGQVSWLPPASLKVPCVTSYTYFPFEKHFCEFEFGSWTHDGDDLLLLPYEDFKMSPSQVTGGEWRLVDYTYVARQYYVVKVNPYNSINLTLSVQRTSSLHKITSVVPVLTSSLMSLAGFWLDVWSTPRYVLGLGNFAMVALQLLHLGTTVPAGKDIPLIAQFSATVVCMSALFLILTVALDSTQRRRGPPVEGLVRFCKQLPEKPLCLPDETDRPESNAADDSADKAKRDWLLVCRVFDRIAFYVFAVIYVIVSSLLFSVA